MVSTVEKETQEEEEESEEMRSFYRPSKWRYIVGSRIYRSIWSSMSALSWRLD